MFYDCSVSFELLIFVFNLLTTDHSNIIIEPIFHQNLDLDSIVTPVHVEKLVDLLKQSNYPTEDILFLQEGFTNGFDLGYEGPEI